MTKRPERKLSIIYSTVEDDATTIVEYDLYASSDALHLLAYNLDLSGKKACRRPISEIIEILGLFAIDLNPSKISKLLMDAIKELDG